MDGFEGQCCLVQSKNEENLLCSSFTYFALKFTGEALICTIIIMLYKKFIDENSRKQRRAFAQEISIYYIDINEV
jgi:hypothetical protein